MRIPPAAIVGSKYVFDLKKVADMLAVVDHHRP
jgi:hypothetical protein